MRIGELASRTGITTKTIRFWESEGLLADPARTPSGYRNYQPDAVDRLKFIRHAQTAGLTLGEIRQVLAISDSGQPPCVHVGGLIQRHLADLDQRIRELTDTRHRLRRLAQRAAQQDPATCDRYCSILHPPTDNNRQLIRPDEPPSAESATFAWLPRKTPRSQLSPGSARSTDRGVKI
ncbi:MAG TPA: heavy metal-responsive transcriptional regulator [Acidimicrobiales bacterium]|nr:heavy metal-responsive transcriptional regulator [Acidimicrobiales bacterium]